MIVFAGLPVKVTDAVFPDHIKAERTAVFCGRIAFLAFNEWSRNPTAPDRVTAPFRESLRTKRSVPVLPVYDAGQIAADVIAVLEREQR